MNGAASGSGIEEMLALDGDGLDMADRDERQEVRKEQKQIKQARSELHGLFDAFELARCRVGPSKFGQNRHARP